MRKVNNKHTRHQTSMMSLVHNFTTFSILLKTKIEILCITFLENFKWKPGQTGRYFIVLLPHIYIQSVHIHMVLQLKMKRFLWLTVPALHQKAALKIKMEYTSYIEIKSILKYYCQNLREENLLVQPNCKIFQIILLRRNFQFNFSRNFTFIFTLKHEF